MTTDTPIIEKLDLASADLLAERLEALKELFPEVIVEGKVDLDRLRQHFGDFSHVGSERYGLTWAGKSEALRTLQQQSYATLTPMRNESVNFDASDNLIIEGDNLEVLKLLQKSYHGQIKMIYIDPPYNTGGDFVYPDNFSEGLDTYLRFSGQIDDEGLKFSTNTETGGRYHSNWLNMMYPRLFMAKSLLAEDGVIFISIDDHEVANLKLLLNEIFGEENFVANVVWQKKYAVSNDDPGIAAMHDYVIVFQRTPFFNRNLLPRNEKQLERYKNPDNDQRGVWASGEYVSSKTKEERPTLWYPIKHPKTGKEVWPEETVVWRYSKEKHEQMERENRLYWGPNQDYEKPRLKRFLSEIQDGLVPSTWWPFLEVGQNDEGQKETAILLGKKIFSTPKPVRLLKRILDISTEKEGLILDFFAGSGTTADAVMQLNKEDGGNRKYILVQLPEPTDEKSEAHKAGFNTIADITRERVRRVITKLQEEAPTRHSGESQNPGYRHSGESRYPALDKNLDSGFRRNDDNKDPE